MKTKINPKDITPQMTIDALAASVEKWRKFAEDPLSSSPYSDGCPLCKLFLKPL